MLERMIRNSWQSAATFIASRRGTTVCVILVVLVAGFVRLDGLGSPSTYVADEGFYARDACWYVDHSSSVCGVSGENTPEHPPLGKWLIGVPIKIAGMHPTDWRLASALAGIATVILLFFLALRLLRSPTAAMFAAGLLAVEPLSIVQSRIATLDVFVTFFGVAAVLFSVLDRDSASARFLPLWRLAAGIACGAAVASKWSGLFVLVTVAALTIHAERARLIRALPSIAICFGLVPAMTYAATYTGRLHGKLATVPWSSHSYFRALGHRTMTMWHDQTGHFATSAYQSPPWSWPLLRRPTVHYASVSHGQIREILAVGSPLVWWFGFAAAAVAAALAIRSRGRDQAAVAVALCGGLAYLPWLLIAHGRSFVFLYYMTPVVPFLCLALGWAAIRARGAWQVIPPAFALASILLLAFWWPILTAQPISYGAWRDRVVFHDCRQSDQPQNLPPDSQGLPQAWVKLLHGSPPGGWCWV